MSDAIAPEKLTAWQRWELPSFEAEQSRRADEVQLPTAAEIEEMQRQTREEGFRQGHEEGFQSGYAEGVQQAVQENQRLTALLDALSQQVDEQVAGELLALSLDIARKVLQQALKVNPELMLGVVREAIGTLPHFNQGAHLVLHPEDAALVRKRMGEQLTHAGWKIFEDDRIERGGVRIETANSQIDATLETRWKHVVAALGQNAEWLVQE